MRNRYRRRLQLAAASTTLALLPAVLAVGAPASVAAASPLTAVAASIPVEATRPDGLIGRWVVVVLLGLVATVWVTLVAVVVRLRLELTRSRRAKTSYELTRAKGSGPSTLTR